MTYYAHKILQIIINHREEYSLVSDRQKRNDNSFSAILTQHSTPQLTSTKTSIWKRFPAKSDGKHFISHMIADILY